MSQKSEELRKKMAKYGLASKGVFVWNIALLRYLTIYLKKILQPQSLSFAITQHISPPPVISLVGWI